MGKEQTPINLPTDINIKSDFEDDCFLFQYDKHDPIAVKKFDEKGDRFFFPMSGHLYTKTAGLFNPHLAGRNVKLSGMQYHFHAPAEHAIDGKLMDMELHIVHAIQPDLTPDKKGGSQFTNGVLGFLFKVVPDEDFKIINDFHDKFLRKMVEDYREHGISQLIDFTEFVDMLNFNRRWSYPGGLTTAPFSEGILWNVVEQVIPIRQSTLDAFTQYQQVEEQHLHNKFSSEVEREAFYNSAHFKAIPEHCKSCKSHSHNNRLFRTAFCNRPIQETGTRPVYHIDVKP